MKIAIILIIILAAGWLSALGLRQFRARTLVPLELVEKADHYKGRHFVNRLPSEELSAGNFFRMAKKFFTEKQPDKRPARPLPVHSITNEFDGPPSENLRFAWLGHSSVILEIEGRRLLLDPMLSERSSLVRWAGPRRFHPAPITVENLPQVDAVLISHDHFDHLDRATIMALADRHLLFYTPIGVGQRLIDWGIEPQKIIQMNWWDSHRPNDLQITATPARHFSGRGLLDRDMTLWTSWTITGDRHRVFFSGDTGPTPDMAEIGERFGPFDLTFIEIGAYDEYWGSIHAGPQVATEIHRQVKGRRMVPIHWATFDLAYHSWYTPAEEVVAATSETEVDLLNPEIGAVINPHNHLSKSWWRPYQQDPRFSPETNKE